MIGNLLAKAGSVPAVYQPNWLAQVVRMVYSEFLRITAFTGEVTWNPASIADGDNATTTITVTGVSTEARAAVRVFAPYSLQGLSATGYVSSDNTVTIVLNNCTGGAVDLGSGVWGVCVENFPFGI